jgi:hypothetical protein
MADRGLTWDHLRGYRAIEPASRRFDDLPAGHSASRQPGAER